MADEHGRVVAYDARRGLGDIERDDGHHFGFHCTAIADGTRDIPVGATVAFRVLPGHLGTWEAAAIRAA